MSLSPDLEQFFALSSDLCCVLGFNGTVQELNPAWHAVLGYVRSEIHGTAFADLLHADDRRQTELELARHVRSSFVTRCRCKDGSYRTLRWQSIASVEHRKIYAIGRAESLAASRSERLLALGQMALGVVHDLKNLVVHPLSLQLQRIERAIESDSKDRARTIIAATHDVLRDGTEAIDRLLRPSDRSALVRDVDVDAVMGRAVEIGRSYARSLSVPREIDFDWTPGRPKRIEADTFDLLAALVNIVFNGIDAVASRGGTITVKTGDGANVVWLTISDNGPGMAGEIRDRIFEPFFTTKADGIGLGLSIVQTCIERHTGTIRVITAPGAGTTIRIELPIR